MTTRTPILFGGIYHLYNHANGGLNLFRNEENYKYFLTRYIKYVHPIVDTLAYCLMPNHFHFLIKVKEQDEISEIVNMNPDKLNSLIISNSIKNWLISYTQAYNKVYNNRGNLYHQKIRRKEINNELHLLSLIAYINLNPIHHKFVINPEDWEFSSYNALISEKKTMINRNLVLELFDGKENFRFYHDIRRLDLLFENLDLEY